MSGAIDVLREYLPDPNKPVVAAGGRLTEVWTALADLEALAQAVGALAAAEDGNSEKPIAAIHNELLAVYVAYQRVLGGAA